MVDRERQKRNQTIRVLIIDIIMLISVVGIILVLVGLVAGWRLGENMTLEQNGLVQIDSMPTGATIVIDGEATMGGTNTSKMLTGGEHEVLLKKDGFDTWSKKIEVTPGWLLNLSYPRLFRQEREAKSVEKFENLEFLNVAPNRKNILYAKDKSAIWYVMTDLGSEKVKTMKVDFSNLFVDDGLEIEVLEIKWNEDGDRVLASLKSGEWLLIDLKNQQKSINISKTITEFKDYATLARGIENAKIREIVLASDSGMEMFVRINDSLFFVNLNDNVIKTTPLMAISEFAVRGDEIIFVTLPDDKGDRSIGLHRVGSEGTMEFSFVKRDENLHVGVSDFYGQKYVIYTVGQKFYVYRGQNFATNRRDEMKMIAESELDFVPDSIEVSRNGEFFVLRKGQKIVTYDAEIEKYVTYESLSGRSQWLDNFMFYGVKDGVLSVWDFDGLNQRELLTKDVADGFDVGISSDDKMLYYVVKVEDGFELRREVIK